MTGSTRSHDRGQAAATPLRRVFTTLLLLVLAVSFSGIGDDAEAARKKRKRRASQTIERTTRAVEAEQDAKVDDLLAEHPGSTVLEAGRLRAVVRSLSDGRALLAGGSAFAEVTVRKPKGSGIQSAEIRITSQGGEPAVIAVGKAVKSMTVGANHVATISFGKSAGLSLLVELKPKAGEASGQGKLGIALATIGEETSAVSAPVDFTYLFTDCSSRFHGALAGILAERADLFASGLKRASTPDDALPGAWVFNPRGSFAGTKKNKKGESAASLEPGVATTGERKLMQIAAEFVSSRGAANDLSRRGRYSWISNRIMTDICSYLEQGSNPALCSGVDIMADFFIGNSGYLKETVDTVAAATAAAEVAAASRVARVTALASGTLPGATAAGAVKAEEAPSFAFVGNANAAMGVATGTTPAPAGRHHLALAVEVARGLFSAADAKTVAEATATLDALGRISALIKSDAASGMSDAIQAEARLALSLIEAAHYLAVGNDHYGLVGNAIYGSLDAIRSARDKTCSCAP